MGPPWGPPGSCRPQMGPMNLAIRDTFCSRSGILLSKIKFVDSFIFTIRGCAYRACQMTAIPGTLQWRHNELNGVPNHQHHDCLLRRLFRRRSTKTSKLRVTGLCEGNSPVTGEFPAQRTVTRKMFPFDDVIMNDYPVTLPQLSRQNNSLRDVDELYDIPAFRWDVMTLLKSTKSVTSSVIPSSNDRQNKMPCSKFY